MAESGGPVPVPGAAAAPLPGCPLPAGWPGAGVADVPAPAAAACPDASGTVIWASRARVNSAVSSVRKPLIRTPGPE